MQYRRYFQNFLMLLGSGLVLCFFSELFFLNEEPVKKVIQLSSSPLGLMMFIIEMALWYGLFAAWFLVPVYLFNAHNLWSVFFAAVLFGWAVEGIIIPLIYLEFPWGILWPSMSWHVFIDVFLGWWLVRYVLYMNDYTKTALMTIALGLFWGLWATWIAEEGVELINPFDFSVICLVGTGMWVLGNIIIDRFAKNNFEPTTIEITTLSILSLIFWGLTTLSLTPLQFIFPVLIALAAYPLYCNKKNEKRPNLIAKFHGQIYMRNHLLVFLTPFTASLVYPYFVNANILIEAWFIALPLMIGGIIMFALSYYKILRTKYNMAKLLRTEKL